MTSSTCSLPLRKQNCIHNFPINTGSASNTYTLRFELQQYQEEPMGVASPIEFKIKGTNSVNNASGNPSEFTLPDETWDISTGITFQPPVAGAFPPDSPYNNDNVSGGHAYIRFAPAHNGKLLKPLIFVDGIDNPREC